MNVDGAAEVAVKTDWKRPVWSALLRRGILRPATLDGLDVNNRAQGPIDAWAETLWFHADAVAAGDLCEKGADGKGWLPCGVSLRALKTCSRTQRFCCKDGELLLSREGTMMGALRALMVSALRKLNRWRSFVEVLKDLGMDAVQYCT